jgi:ATP-dependent RNA helicase RhlB
MAVYGGIDYVKQKQEVLRGPIDLVAATPGRLLDFQNQHVLDLKHVEILVLDEADRMLDMGFIPDVKRIISKLPPKEKRRTLLFSATLSEDVMRLARQWMPDPVTVEMAAEQVTVDRIRQRILIVTVRDKFRILVNMLRRPEMKRVLVFANRRDTARELSEALRKQGIHCQLISGEVEQGKRQRILEDFRAGRIQAMIATDVAARGLHIDNVSHVINFDLPYEPQDYVHRIGRTGRAGLEGESISFADEESFVLPDIEKFIGKALPCEQPEESLLADLPY